MVATFWKAKNCYVANSVTISFFYVIFFYIFSVKVNHTRIIFFSDRNRLTCDKLTDEREQYTSFSPSCMYQDIFKSLIPSIFRRILIFLFIKFFSKSHWTELFFLGTLGSFSLFVFREVEVIAIEYKTTTGVRAPMFTFPRHHLVYFQMQINE